MDRGQVGLNPLGEVQLTQPHRKERNLPTREQLDAICAKVEEQNPRNGKAIALTIRLLAFSGMRVGEARGFKWERAHEGFLHIVEQRDGRA